MKPKDLKTSQSLAVIFGASEFPRNPLWEKREAFKNSAEAIHIYLTSGGGLQIPESRVLDLFNDPRDPMSQLDEIEQFILLHNKARSGKSPENLLVYYVGHGCFDDQKHCFAISCTKRDQYGRSAIRGRDLITLLRQVAPFQRLFVIIDCCFAAQLYSEFQSTPGQALEMQLQDDLPTRGAALLCASGRDSASVARESWTFTMFTKALLDVLGNGHKDLGSRMSLREIQKLCVKSLKKRFPDDFVRPEVHAPMASDGDVAEVPFFPNSAQKNSREEESYISPNEIVVKDGEWRSASGEWKPVQHLDTVRFTMPEVRGIRTGFKMVKWHQDQLSVVQVGDPLFSVRGFGLDVTVTSSDRGLLLSRYFEEGESVEADVIVGEIAPL